MWRIQSVLSRVLSRFHGNAQLRLSQGHHVEDEVINTSILTAGRHACDSSSQRSEDHQNKKRTSQFSNTGLPRYTALDAVGWGAAAVLFVQVCRRIHSRFSSHPDQNPAPAQIRDAGLLQKCTYKVLIDIFSRQNVLPNDATLTCLRGLLRTSEQSAGSTDGNHDNNDNIPAGDVRLDQQTAHSLPQQQLETVNSLSHSDQTLFPEQTISKEQLSPDEAVQNFKHVTDSSVPVILNIIGLENAKVGHDETAFLCFLASAQLNYSKAQFNVGVCYERGRGVQRDHSKAVQYYRWAAVSGHHQAQYRCAKLLLSSRGQQTDTSTALSFLHTAADAGLTQAQVYLGVVLSDADDRRAIHYFRRAAQSGDSRALLYLAQCYESGFGVCQCVSTAVSLYQQAAARGNKQARDILTHKPHNREVLRSIRSAPCFSVIGQLNLNSVYPQKHGDVKPNPQQQSDWLTGALPHSWSTGSLMMLSSKTLQTLNDKTCCKVWTQDVR